MEPSRKGKKGAGGIATRLRARMSRLRATRPCGMKPDPCSMEPGRKMEAIACASFVLARRSRACASLARARIIGALARASLAWSHLAHRSRIKAGPLWCSLRVSGAFCCPLGLFVAFWCFLGPSEAFWASKAF
eukprot:4121994-Karenia_brevis.AAC.1